MCCGAIGLEAPGPATWLAVLLAAGLGALVGSFVGTAAVRLPQGRSVVSGRSRCDSCGERLGLVALVPILSFVAQRGRCRRCSAPIDRMHLAGEVGGAVVGAASLAVVRDPAVAILGMALGWQALLLALLDARHFWLPRPLVLLLALSGLAALAVERSGPDALRAALGGGALGFAMLWLAAALYRRWRGREGLGAGDPPLLGAVGLWVGPVGVIAAMLGGSLAGLAGVAGQALAGRRITAQTVWPLGSGLALAGWTVWLVQHVG